MEEKKLFNLQNKMYKALFYVSALILTISCDTPTKLIVKNKTNGDAICCFREKVSIKPDSLFCVQLSEKEPNAVIPIGFARRWTNEYIDVFSQQFSSLEIIARDDTLSIFGSEKIFDFLQRQRVRYSQRHLIITIDDALFAHNLVK